MESMGKVFGHRLTIAGSTLFVGLVAATLGPAADARVTRLEILSVQSPNFQGLSFGTAGQYEKIRARAFGEIDPADPRNAGIVDLDLAPKNASGKVEYSTNVYILKPIDLSKGSGKMFYEVVNRGSKLATGTFNGGGGSDPTTAAQAGDGLLMRLGYSMVWAGWEDVSGLPTGATTLNASFPALRNSDGSSITQVIPHEEIFDNTTTMTVALTYRVATLDKSAHKLFVRNNINQPLVEVPASDWSLDNDRLLRINRNSAFLSAYDAGAAYHFYQLAADPHVSGLGYAATRDVVSFLRHDTSSMNPLRGGIQHTMAYGYSQSGKFLRSFIEEGYNEDEAGRRVFDGAMPSGLGSQPSRAGERFWNAAGNNSGRGYEQHEIGKWRWPFGYPVLFDPISGKTDGILAKCLASATCPKIMHNDGGGEWSTKAASLVVTDALGNDLDLANLAPNVRVYFHASVQHGPSASPTVSAVCQQRLNPNQFNQTYRALLVALDQWVSAGVLPPSSRHPKLSDGTRVRTPLTAAAMGWPAIPGVTFTGFYNQRRLVDSNTIPWKEIPGTEYGEGLPATDADGIERGGISSTTIQAPIATYTGWGVRRAGFAEGMECGSNGQYIAFPATQAERIATGDPRLSVKERYPTHVAYVARVSRAANDLVRQRFLLREDADRAMEAAASSTIGN